MLFDFNRSNIDHYLYLVAREYKKANRTGPEAEVIIAGGASVIMNYNFRDSTTDIDSIIRASSSMRDIINRIGDENGLPPDWLNDDFRNTSSYSEKLIECSSFYKRFCNCLNVRTVSAEYLIAMKARVGRIYKHDLSDIAGIIKEHQEMKKDMSLSLVEEAYKKLYGEEMSIKAAERLKGIFECKDLEELFYSMQSEEKANRQAVLQAIEKYGEKVNDKNIDGFIRHFRESTFSEDTGNKNKESDMIPTHNGESFMDEK